MSAPPITNHNVQTKTKKKGLCSIYMGCRDSDSYVMFPIILQPRIQFKGVIYVILTSLGFQISCQCLSFSGS